MWDANDFKRLEQARLYTDVAAIAIEVARRIPAPVSEVCGPLTTGGMGSLEENIRRFSRAIEWLKQAGFNVFDQRPVERYLGRIAAHTKTTNSRGEDILGGFYLPLFESGAIHVLHFMPEWGTSTGATWERLQAERLGIEIVDFPPDWDSS